MKSKPASIPQKTLPEKTLSSNHFPVVGIGASAGGLDAFKKLLSAIPENSGMAYVLVQHLDPTHESMLPELLQKVTKIPVLEITDDLKVQPDHIYIIPSNKMMVANDGVLELSPRQANKSERNLPIDLFFTSLADVHQSHAIGVVLSGTGSDGTRGLKAIKDHGGITFAQDPKSAAYEGMPQSAAHAEVVDFILPPEQIPQKLQEVVTSIHKSDDDLQNPPLHDEEVFKQILSLLRVRKGTDFTYYKQTTIRRRILRRMAVNKNEDTGTYFQFLRENKTEQDALYQDLLIPVTSFFRDPKVFDNLCESLFPQILKNKSADISLRIWVAGCSTGQEAYSIAICLKELLGSNGSSDAGAIQIFATDLSEPAIAKARAGIYTKSELDTSATESLGRGLTPQRLQHFFTKNNGGYQVNKQIREMCVFAVHNFLRDPPFGKMDFISCRNVLIYMDPYLQKKALTTFHYALNQKGFLLLGKSETINNVPDLFTSAGKQDKLFVRKDVPSKYMHAASQRIEQNLLDINDSAKSDSIRSDFQKAADHVMLSKYIPAGVVVNEALDIVQFRGKTGSYLEQSSGKPSHNLLKMAKDGLAFELRNILHKAKKEKVPVVKENIPVQVNGIQQSITIEAVLLPDTIEPHYLILFHDKELSAHGNQLSVKKTATPKIKNNEKELRIQQLELELRQTREDMRAITEDQEASNEELQSANEELLSSSEELQSLNEELETGREELQSTNEELTVVNQELTSLNEQLTAEREYAESIVATIREPLLVLDKNLRVKTANSNFYKTFKVNEQDTEGVLIYDLGNKQWNIPALRTLLEEILPEKAKLNDFEVKHNFPAIGERVMMLDAREITREKQDEKLILLAIEDVTQRTQQHLKETELLTRFQNLVMQAPVAICILKGRDYLVEVANNSYLQLVERDQDFIGKPLFQSLPELKSQGIKELLDNVFEKGIPFYGNEHEVHINRHKKGEKGYFNFVYQPIWEHGKNVSGIMVVATEVTDQVISRNKNLESQQLHAKELEERVLQRTLELREANESLQLKNQELAISKYNKLFLTDFSEKFSAYKPHLEFFTSLVQYISDLTHLDYVFVGKVVQTGTNEFVIHTIAFNTFGKPAENIRYPLRDGPCEQLIQDIPYSFPKECRQTFPKNQTLVQFNVEGYIAYPLFDAAGIAQGLIAVMHEKEIEDADTVVSVLKIAAKRAEIELERIKYEGQLEQTNETLEEKNEELGKMNKELQSFAYISSHDLQEPLRKIHSFSLRILEKENANLSESGKDYFRRMQSAAKRMQQLIEDLLLYSRTNTNERKFESTDLNKIIEEVKTELRETILEKNAIIEATELCAANIIPFQFRQLMVNLIGNSLKFSNPEQPPHIIIKSEIVNASKLSNAKPALTPGKEFVRTDSQAEEKKYCHISISDNGIGFEPEYKDRIFEVFQRLHGKNEYPGTGIGLAIVKKIVDNHNGIITATGELNQGALFDIYIPENF